jgi:hypothetical protein
LNEPFELPSLEQLELMDSQRSQAIEALKISNDSAKCQKCGNSVPLVKVESQGSIELMLCKSRSSGSRERYVMTNHNRCLYNVISCLSFLFYNDRAKRDDYGCRCSKSNF